MPAQLKSLAKALVSRDNSESRTRAEKVFQTLQSDITKGHIKPGSKVSEADLAAKYGISRGPLREAFQRLESRGLIERIPHVGTRVVSLKLDELLEIYQVRECLEGLACRLAAENMSDSDIQELSGLLDKHAEDAEVSSGQAYFQKEGDSDFHYLIIRGAKNEHLSKQVLGVMYHLLRMYRYQCSLYEGRPQKALKEHRAILDAIAERDADLAEMLMKKHIRQARNSISERYEQKDFDLINA